MKVTIKKYEPPPPPEDVVIIEMTRSEAELYATFLAYTGGMDEAFVALHRAGVRERKFDDCFRRTSNTTSGLSFIRRTDP